MNFPQQFIEESKRVRSQFDAYARHSKILLLYSGGLDTSFLLKYFSDELGIEVFTVVFQLGGEEEVFVCESRAYALGSRRHIASDARDEFVNSYCLPALKANALFDRAHPLSSSLSRPLMAKIGVQLARKFGCTAIMHGSNGWQNNSARFDSAIRALDPGLQLLEPIMEQNISREFEFAYLRSKGVEIQKKEDNLLSSDNNIWGREVEDGILERASEEPAEDIYRITANAEFCPDQPEYMDIQFKNGIPIALNGKISSLREMVESLNVTAGKHGIGRHDAFEDKVIGYKMREIHESPAATVLIQAHHDLESLVLPRKTLSVKRYLEQQWIELVCFGGWFHPLRHQLDVFIDATNDRVNGTIRLKFFKGLSTIVGRTSTQALNCGALANAQSYLGQDSHPNRDFYDYSALETMMSSLTDTH
jgi:argininosuccinate synthase